MSSRKVSEPERIRKTSMIEPDESNKKSGSLQPSVTDGNDDWIGCNAKRFAGRYRVISELGEGGWGTVYKCLDETLGRTVAVKRLHTRSTEKLERFRREAVMAAGLNHPHICAVFDIGALLSDEPFIVMEYIEGKSLEELIGSSTTCNERYLTEVFIQIAGALHYAHQQGIVHRDLKPCNIVVGTNDERKPMAKVVDFGLAKAFSVEPTTGLTMTGETVGTPSYMSPEQCCAMPVDGRSDVYSLGCVMFHALSGRVPFPADSSFECMLKHFRDEAQSLQILNPHVSSQMASIVNRALQKAPEKRYQSALELQLDLENHRMNVDNSAGAEMFNRLRRHLLPSAKQDNKLVQVHGNPKYALVWAIGVLASIAVAGMMLVLSFRANDDANPKIIHQTSPAGKHHDGQEFTKQLALARELDRAQQFANQHTDMGYRQAKECYEQALKLGSPSTMAALVKACDQYRTLITSASPEEVASNRNALLHCLQIYESAPASHNEIAAAECDVGLSYYYGNDVEHARVYFSKAAESYRQSGRSADRAYLLYLLSCTYARTSDWSQAITFIDESARLFAESEPSGDSNYSAALMAAGRYHHASGNVSKAEQFLRRCLAMRRALGEKPDKIVECRDELQAVLQAQGKPIQ